MLQWGRDFNVAESRPFRRGTTYTDRLQWGRDFNVAERRYAHANHGVPEICFNGAATLTSRRAVSSSASLNMLPRLQWGRDFNVAERTLAAYATIAASKLQWGRDFNVAERKLLCSLGCD